MRKSEVHDNGMCTDSRLPTSFLTMEFLEGTTLADRSANQVPLPTCEAESIAIQLCLALQAIHEAGSLLRPLSGLGQDGSGPRRDQSSNTYCPHGNPCHCLGQSVAPSVIPQTHSHPNRLITNDLSSFPRVPSHRAWG
jgi:serine/threonine protein kinase